MNQSENIICYFLEKHNSGKCSEENGTIIDRSTPMHLSNIKRTALLNSNNVVLTQSISFYHSWNQKIYGEKNDRCNVSYTISEQNIWKDNSPSQLLYNLVYI